MRARGWILVCLPLLWLARCSGCSDDSGVAPCERDDAPPQCGQECILDDDCGPDLYCGLEQVCTADCSPGGSQCEAGEICADHGRCIANPNLDGGTGDGGVLPDAEPCGTVSVDLQPTIPTVVILIDQSGSMTSDFGGVTRWQAVRTALVADPDGVVTQLEDEVIFGATLYTSDGGFSGGTCPILTTVDPAINNLTDIRDLLQNNGPSGDTPTGESVDAVAQALANLPDNPEYPNSPKVIVLATDGEPDTCAAPNPQEGQPESVAAVTNAYQLGIETFVLSVGSGVSDDHLQELANLGVGLPADGSGGDSPFFVANSQQELVDAFHTIINGTRSCEFTVDGIVEMDKADEAVVRLNGQTLVYGTDWQMADQTTLELLGTACDTFLTEEQVILTADFPCGAIVQ